MAQLRSVSSGTDVLSMSARSTRASLPHTTAPSAYVSGPEAEKLVYAEIERVVKISNGALHLLNGFLDQVLYDTLSKSQSTGLAAVRAAIPLVLKQRLSRAAVKVADEELQDYLDEEELEEIQNRPAVLDPRAEFDVDLAWKLTRLRCMVYAKLGDMEEEDEEDYLEGDDIREHLSQVRDAYRSSARILPACAIFLTTVLEFLAEQALCIAAQHARKRDTFLKDPVRTPGPILLEEIDMSGIGKEGPLIRLWRSWKGSVRTGGSGFSRPTTPSIVSPVSPDSPNQEWRFPTVPVIASITEESRSGTPANIPLPMGDNDVQEIEAPESMEARPTDGTKQRSIVGKRNSTSVLFMPGQFPDSKNTSGNSERPLASRRRSRSVPTAPRPPSSTYSVSSRKILLPAGQEGLEGTSARYRGDSDGEGESRPSGTHDQLGEHSTAIGATVATIAGALSVEASRTLRRDRSAETTKQAEVQSAVEPHSSISTTHDVDRMHVPLQAPAAATGAAEEAGVDGLAEIEEAGAQPGDDERDDTNDERMNLRDSGFGVAGSENEMTPQHLAAGAAFQPPTIDQYENTIYAEMPGDDIAPSNRSSNVGYATIFQTPNTSASYSSSNSAHTSGPPTVRADEVEGKTMASTTVGSQSTSAWPAVVPNRDAGVRPHNSPPFLDQNGEPSVPRFATSAYARSRSASANQGRPSTSGSASARRQHIRLRSEDTEVRPLDLLIDSDETLRYTLTPASAEVESRPKPKSQTRELADFFRETAPPGQEARPKSSRSTKDGLNGLRANPPTPVTAKATPSQPPIPSPSRPKNPVGEPREARMVHNNTRDLADYARSTGPENPTQLPKALAPRPPTAQRSKTDTSPREKALGDDSRPNTAKTTNRLKYQARDAKVPRTTQNSDLIDFIREGPPRAAGDHRIDRHVAPFRTTMDSDDFNALSRPSERDTNGRSSEASVPDSALTAKSMPSSMNSRTGLLESSNRAGAKPVNTANVVSKQPMIPERDDGMPRRTRRRIRDPYAIDYSDEEEEVEEVQAPPKRRTEEESLVDFLRNTAPPPSMITQPIYAAVPQPTQPDPSSTLNRTSSSSKLKDFLPGGSGNKASASANGNGHEATPAARSVNVARASSPHLTQAGSKLDIYKPTTPTHAAHVERNRTQNKSRVEPRGAASNGARSSTADLAAFLKESGPPSGMNDTPVQKFNPSVQRDQAGFMKFFQRRPSVKK